MSCIGINAEPDALLRIAIQLQEDRPSFSQAGMAHVLSTMKLSRSKTSADRHLSYRQYGCNICGEGGEYETLVLDCPLFSRARITLDAWEIQHLSAGDVAILRPTEFHTQPKTPAGASTTAGNDTQRAANVDQVHIVPAQQEGPQQQAASRAEQQMQATTFHAEPAICRSRQALSASCAPQAAGDLGGVLSDDAAEAALDAALEGISEGRSLSCCTSFASHVCDTP